MKLNASKTKTMLESRSRTVHLKSSRLTIGGTVLKEFYVLVKLGVTINSKMTFEKYLGSNFRAASQRPGILRMSWRVFNDRVLPDRDFQGFIQPVLEYCSAVWCSSADADSHLTSITGPWSQWRQFFNWLCVCVYHYTSSICGSAVYAV